MITLVIDTATEACSAALLRDGAVLAERYELVGRGHAERLVPMIEELLIETGIAHADAVLVDCGPGSFTGIRVGLAAARAFGFAWSATVHGYSSMALLAAMQEGGSVAVAVTGGHGEVFVQRFARSPLTPLSELTSMPPGEAAAIFSEERVIGSGAEAVVTARQSGQAVTAYPRAADAYLLPAVLTDLAPTPLYGRPPDAKRAAP